MKIKLIKRQILDEWEEQLVNKAGMEAFSLLLYGGLALYANSMIKFKSGQGDEAADSTDSTARRGNAVLV